MLVQDNKQLYVTLPKRQKMLLSQSIVKAVRSQAPPGRFLQKDPHTELWYDVGDQRATEKTSQALREGAPDIRNKIGTSKPDSTTSAASPTPPHEASSVGSGSKGSVSSSRAKSKAKSSPTAAVSVPSPSSTSSSAALVTPVPLPPQPMTVAPASPSSMAIPPPHIPPPVQPQGPVPDRRKRKDKKDAAATAMHDGTATTNTKSPPDMDSVYHPVHHHGPVEPPAPLDVDQGFSLGSIAMTDAEQAQLMNGCSIGSAYDFQPTVVMPYQSQQPQHHAQHTTSYHQGYNNPYRSSSGGGGTYDDDHDGGSSDPYEPEPLPPGRPLNAHQHDQGGGGGMPAAEAPLPVDGGLEPAGFSMGSVMSTGTTLTDALDLQNSLFMKLEPAGFSLGSMMSYVKETPAAATGDRSRHSSGVGGIPLPPDAGLEAIGTSFGSLTLATAPPGNDYDYHPSAAAAAPPPPPAPSFGSAATNNTTAPTLLQQQRSTVNLLDCSDSDEEQDASSAAQRSFFGGGAAGGGGGSGSGATGLSSTKSAEYEKLRATLESQNYAALPTSNTSRTASATSQRSAASRNMMPPPAPVVQWHTDNNNHHRRHNHQYAQNRTDAAAAAAPPPQFHFQLPTDSIAPPATTAFYRDVSQMSALSVDDDYYEHGGFGGMVVPGAPCTVGPASAPQPPADGYHYQDSDAMPPPPPPPMMKQRDDTNNNNNSEWERTDQQYLYYNR